VLNTSTTQLRKAEQADILLIQSWLQQNDLPHSDVLDILESLFFVQHKNIDVGLGGFESYPPYGLMRSVVIAEPFRGQGYGKKLCHLLFERAIAQQIHTLFLLTTTAPDYFASLGFEQVERQTAPTILQSTTEFSHLCPSSAVCMRLDLPAIVNTELHSM